MSTNQSNAKYLNIRDIAKLAGVSTATVSRVLNHPELTSPEIRARVQAIVQAYHYVPNQMVKSLFSHSADSIAVFVYDMANPFFTICPARLCHLYGFVSLIFWHLRKGNIAICQKILND